MPDGAILNSGSDVYLDAFLAKSSVKMRDRLFLVQHRPLFRLELWSLVRICIKKRRTCLGLRQV